MGLSWEDRDKRGVIKVRKVRAGLYTYGRINTDWYFTITKLDNGAWEVRGNVSPTESRSIGIHPTFNEAREDLHLLIA